MGKHLNCSIGRPRLSSSWTWEIAAIFSTIISFLVLIIVLVIYDGNTVFNWHSLTLNTIVSILSTVSKTTLLFAVTEAIGQWKWILFARDYRPLRDFERVDAASRGPLGSARLLWPTPETSFLRIGAVIILLALAYDPFTQQIVQYEQYSTTNTSAPALIGRAQKYAKGTLMGPDGLQPNATAITAVDLVMQSGILLGLAQPYDTVLKQTAITCPSSNCTWAPFQSLAVSSVCNDLSDQIDKYSEASGLYRFLSNAGVAISNTGATTFRLPNGLLINNVNNVNTTGGAQSITTFMTTFGTGNASQTNTFRESNNLIWSMSLLRWQQHSSLSAKWPDVPLEALECGLFYQVNEYKAVVQNGMFKENEFAVENATRDLTSYQPYGGYRVNLTDEDIGSIDFDNSTSKRPRTDLRFGNNFNISEDAVKSISNYFHLSFANQVVFNYTRYAASRDGYTGLENLHGPNGYYIRNNDGGNPVYAPSVMQAIYNSNNITDMFRAVARSMTNTIRADNATTSFVGTTNIMVTVYQIQWPWIALQAFLTSSGGVFLLITIRMTKHGRIPTWKSSSLALLSRSNEVGQFCNGIESVETMEEKARQHHIRLFHSTMDVQLNHRNGISSQRSSNLHSVPLNGATPRPSSPVSLVESL